MADAGDDRMHAAEREAAIFRLLGDSGFVSFRELERSLGASPATIRRDLERLASEGRVVRVHGGAKLTGESSTGSLTGVPFHQNIALNRSAKEAIGRAAAEMCRPGEGVIIDGGSTTLQMCQYLDGLGLQVLTNSLHIVSALLPQPTTRIALPGGSLFREQNIVLSAGGDDLMPNFHSAKLFMGAAAVGPSGLMQADVVLVAAERRLMERADQLIVLVDSSKFLNPSGIVVCELNEIDILVTDDAITKDQEKMLSDAGVELVVARS
jgi:DeoR family ulaG and ulaABCDEF operon transcriptional repressor